MIHGDTARRREYNRTMAQNAAMRGALADIINGRDSFNGKPITILTQAQALAALTLRKVAL